MTPQTLSCRRCNAGNSPDATYCFRCGSTLKQPTPASAVAPSSNKTLWITLGIIFAVFGSCGLCAIVGALGDKSKSTSNSNVAAASTPSAAPTATPKPTFAELERRAQPLLNLTKEEYSRDDLKPFDELNAQLREIPKTAKEYSPAQALLNKLIQKSARIGAEIIVLGPKPANSPWDGRVNPVVEYLKANLNDYDSSEFVEWSPVTKIELKGEPYWGVRLKLRAKNAFGAYLLRDTFYFIRQNRVVRTEGL